MIHYHFELSKKRLRNTNEQYKNDKELLNQYDNVSKEELQGEITEKVTLETDYHLIHYLIHYLLRYPVICNDEANTKLRVGFDASGALVLLTLFLKVNTVRCQGSRPFYLIFKSTISGKISETHSNFHVK